MVDAAMDEIQLRLENFHDVDVKGKRFIMVVTDSSIFELDEVSSSVLDYLKVKRVASESEILAHLAGGVGADEARKVLDVFSSFGLISNGNGQHQPANHRKAPMWTNDALTTIAVNVSNRCNLGCGYCYGGGFEDLTAGSQMTWAIARKSVDLLFQRSRPGKNVTIVFFGGEPLLNFKLIKQVVTYARERAVRHGQLVDFTITTNGTALTTQVIDFLREHRFGVTVSIDGPREIHDRHRRFKNGRGTYDVIRPRIKELLQSYRTRPIGARVTLTRGVTAVTTIFDHLIDFGFAEVGFSPVTSGDNETHTLREPDLLAVYTGFQGLAERFLQKALEDEYLGFSNLSHMITDFANGTNKVLPCGAGIGLLDIDHKGDVYLCHRFAGTPGARSYGNVGLGRMDFVSLQRFLNAARVDNKADCRTCWIRRLCAGGCYHEAYTKYGDPLRPNLHYCDLLRGWMETGLQVYLEIVERNPGFIKKYLEPRQASYETL